MTTDAEVQTVIYIPVRRRVEPGPGRIEEEPELQPVTEPDAEPERIKEGAHGTELDLDTSQAQAAHRS